MSAPDARKLNLSPAYIEALCGHAARRHRDCQKVIRGDIVPNYSAIARRLGYKGRVSSLHYFRLGQRPISYPELYALECLAGK
jgi:hypothetical protein